jgi:hypothetical protein
MVVSVYAYLWTFTSVLCFKKNHEHANLSIVKSINFKL